MKHRGPTHFCFAGILLAICSPARAQQSQPPAETAGTIKVETKVVLVDAVVTDKKGNYIRDLTANDFRVWEDGKEQRVTSFSREDANTDPANASRHYMVLFFDDSTMEFGDQAKARDAASKFIDANAGPDRLIAIVEFGGMLRITQNFTGDSDRLKKAVAGVKFSTVWPNGSPEVASLGAPPSQPQVLGIPSMGGLEADFGARSVFLALRALAQGLAGVPGRKAVVILSSGFAMTLELQSELTAVIDTCNKANVAVYPIDVRGLVVPMPTGADASHSPRTNANAGRYVPVVFSYPGNSNTPLLRFASFVGTPGELLQKAGSGGGGTGGGATGGGGGHPGGGTGGAGGGHPTGGGTGAGGHPVTGMTPAYSGANSPFGQPRQIVPSVPNVAANQQFLYQLAGGTGGFVIVNTNDLVGGMQRIANDQSDYYLLGYNPPDSAEGSCHTLKVKVDRGGTEVRSRSGFCKVRPHDLLAGSTTEKNLESRATGEMPANTTASIRTPYFYSAPDVARVHLVMEIPSASVQFEKVKGKQHAEINVLGIAYKPDASIAARFSDTVNLDFDGQKDVEEFRKKPFYYENQFEIGAGKYTLRVAFKSGNDMFGKVENPLHVFPFDGQKITLSSIALSNSTTQISDLDTSLDAELLDDRKPLVVRGMQVSPSATNHFKKTDNAVAYIEVYDPALAGKNPPQLGLEYRIIDMKTAAQKLDVGVMDTKDLIKPGNPVVPVGVKLPLGTLPPGTYRVDLRAEDSAGNSTDFRIAGFELE